MYDKGARVPATSTAAEPDSDQYAAKPGVPTTLNNAPRIDMKLPESLILGGKVARILYAVGLASSVSEGNRVAIQKGAYIGGSPGQKAETNKGMSLNHLDFTPVTLWFPKDTKNFIIGDKYLILRKGKHNIRIVEMVTDEEWKRLGLTYPGEPYTGVVRQLRSQVKQLQQELSGEAVAGGAAKGAAADEWRDDDAWTEEPAKLTFPEDKSAQRVELEEKLAHLQSMKASRR